MMYSFADICLLCFSVSSRDSFENVKCKWLGELKELNPSIPFLLIGLKSDLREGGGRGGMVSLEEAMKVCGEIGAEKYLECSSLTQDGLSELLDQTVRTALEHELKGKVKQKKNFCDIF